MVITKETTSEEVKKAILDTIVGVQSCTTCQNACCRVETSEKVGVDEDGYPMGTFCIGYVHHDDE